MYINLFIKWGDSVSLLLLIQSSSDFNCLCTGVPNNIFFHIRISLLEKRCEKYWIWPGCSLPFGHIRTRTFFHSDSGAKKDLFTKTKKGWSETDQTTETVSKIFILFLLWAWSQQLYELQLTWNTVFKGVSQKSSASICEHLHFHTLISWSFTPIHTFGFEADPIQIRIAKAWIPITARNFLGPRDSLGFVPFYPILFLPSDSNVSLLTHGCS